MAKFFLIFLNSLLLFSYNDFISDGNNSDYVRLDHIVNTNENKIYLAVGVKDIGGDELDLVKIDALGANVLITRVRTIRDATTEFGILKFLALKDENDQYIGEYVLAGILDNGRLEHFSYSTGAGYVAISQHTYPLINSIYDIVQRKDGRFLYFVSNKASIVGSENLIITQNGDIFEDGKHIYERYLNIGGVLPRVPESYLAEVEKDNVANIRREFAFNLDGGGVDVNAQVAKADTFFTLGFHTAGEGALREDLTVIGLNNEGSEFALLGVNTTRVETGTPILTPPALIPPDYTLLADQPVGTLVTVGSTAKYPPEYNALNLTQVIGPAFDRVYDAGDVASHTLERIGNISKLTQGYYNVSLGAPYDRVINWLDVNCTKEDKKYIIPWSEARIQALTGTLTNQKGKTDYELCRTNDKFLYKSIDSNVTRIQRQWQFIYDDVTPILWRNNIPSNAAEGGLIGGRIETITTDNTSIAMISQPRPPKGGIELLRIRDSMSGNIANNVRVKWRKTYRTGAGDGNNESQVLVNGPNLLKTIANDFLVTGNSRDLTRTGTTKRFDCVVIKFDKNGNELWTKSLGGFHDDNCYSVVLEKNNTSPFYNDYIAVGNSGTRNEADANAHTSYAVKFRDEGTLLHLADGWSLITNGTDRKITAEGKKEESDTMGITNLGAYKSYFQFIKNQWLINKYPIEPLTGFWIYTIDGRHDIFLEGNLLEQTFNSNDLGWVLLGTGVKLINAKQKFNLTSLWKFKDQRWIENPTEINPGEGFWAKKKR